MHRIMIQPLGQGVRLTALFDDFCDGSPLKTPYIYSAKATLQEADFSSKAARTVLAQFSSNARTILRSTTSSTPSKQPSSPDYGLENLIDATKTSPADVIVIYAFDRSDGDMGSWSPPASLFLDRHKSNKRGNYAQILSSMDDTLPVESYLPAWLLIEHRVSCSHPLGMCDLRWE